MEDVKEQLEQVAGRLGLKFETQHSGQTQLYSFFIISDAFFSEVCCQGNGTFTTVRLVQASTQVFLTVLYNKSSLYRYNNYNYIFDEFYFTDTHTHTHHTHAHTHTHTHTHTPHARTHTHTHHPHAHTHTHTHTHTLTPLSVNMSRRNLNCSASTFVVMTRLSLNVISRP